MNEMPKLPLTHKPNVNTNFADIWDRLQETRADSMQNRAMPQSVWKKTINHKHADILFV